MDLDSNVNNGKRSKLTKKCPNICQHCSAKVISCERQMMLEGSLVLWLLDNVKCISSPCQVHIRGKFFLMQWTPNIYLGYFYRQDANIRTITAYY